MKNKIFFYLSKLNIFRTFLDMDQPIVETYNGKVQGFVSKHFNGDKFYSFLGIPYAKPPVGNLRFKVII